MKSSTSVLSLAVVSLALLSPAFSNASAQSNGQTAQPVAALASLTQTLDADRATPGFQFRATLKNNVHLTSGTELRRGDTLLGTVATSDTNTADKSHLTVRFTQALLKNGQTIPIKATIIAFYTPDNLLDDDAAANDPLPTGWNDGTLNVDQIGVTKDVDLHSRIASNNSGVFVSTRSGDIKLPAGSELGLAIAAQPNSGTSNGY